jgi:hypothetical protein
VQLQELIFYPRHVALPKEHFFQVRLQVDGGDQKKPAITVGIVMGQTGILPDFGIHQVDDAIQRRRGLTLDKKSLFSPTPAVIQSKGQRHLG